MKKIGVLFLLCIVPVVCFAQHYENEVYTTYGDLQYYFATNKIIYMVGDTVWIKFTITNISESEVTVTCGSSVLVNFYAFYDSSTFATWFYPTSGASVITTYELSPVETIGDSIWWVLAGVTEGNYSMKACLNSWTPEPHCINLEVFVYAVGMAQENLQEESGPSIFITAAPNPCKENLKIAYYVPHRGMMELAVFDILGRKVNTIAKGWHRPGLYSASWNSEEQAGTPAPSGTYLIKLTNRDISTSKKVHLVR